MLTYGQVIFRDLAIVDNNGSECSSGGAPFFLITNTIVHFQNVSIRGASPHNTSGSWPCNDALVFGANYGGPCGNMTTNDCFRGYGTTFYNIFFSRTRRMGVFNYVANGIDFDYVFGDYTNGNPCPLVNSGGMCGSTVTGSAFEFNVTAGTANNYGNTSRTSRSSKGSPVLEGTVMPTL